MKRTLVCLVALTCAFGEVGRAQTSAPAAPTITVGVDRPGARIPSTMFGLFFEDINFGADGGIYPERVKNRSFEFPDAMTGWKKIGAAGEATIASQNPPLKSNPHYLRLTATDGRFGVTNEGFRGIGLAKGAAYNFSVYARADGAAKEISVELMDENDRPLGAATIKNLTTEWRKHTATLRPAAGAEKARLSLALTNRGTVELDAVSLYPAQTWGERANGLRPDLVRLLKDMRPGFLRFPGGCIVEGKRLETRYQWKTTIGPVDERRLLINRWNDEFKHRPTPDYFQSFGLGFYEYFLLSEDIGAEPLPILNCGMACQFNSNELAPLDDLDEYIQDALDLIEFANGPAVSAWGRKRAEMGHAAPFNLKMIGVGNEQWGPQYIERYERFAAVLKEKHPEIALVSSSGPSADGERFDFAWTNLRRLKADLIDEHYYMAPSWFLANARRYDDYPRQGPKVFAGEFAAQTAGTAKPTNRNNWEAALAEAAFMTGLERNADVVKMASYAPLFGHVDAWQWTPNLIWFDNLRSYGTPNYYVQQLFGAHRGTTVLPVAVGGGGGGKDENNLYVSASSDEASGEVILKVVNATAAPKEARINLEGSGRVTAARAYTLASANLKAENSLDAPTKIAPVERKINVASTQFAHTFAPQSLTVLRVSNKQ